MIALRDSGIFDSFKAHRALYNNIFSAQMNLKEREKINKQTKTKTKQTRLFHEQIKPLLLLVRQCWRTGFLFATITRHFVVVIVVVVIVSAVLRTSLRRAWRVVIVVVIVIVVYKNYFI